MSVMRHCIHTQMSFHFCDIVSPSVRPVAHDVLLEAAGLEPRWETRRLPPHFFSHPLLLISKCALQFPLESHKDLYILFTYEVLSYEVPGTKTPKWVKYPFKTSGWHKKFRRTPCAIRFVLHFSKIIGFLSNNLLKLSCACVTVGTGI